MKLLKKYYFIIGIALLFVVYIFTRLAFIKQIPWFIDETIYAHWAQVGYYDASMRLTSLADGKQPLYIWLVSLLMTLVGNPISAGRIVSAITGALTLAGIITVTYTLTSNKKMSLIAALVYILSPLAFILNRMALYDSTAAMFYIWSLYITLRMSRSLGLADALISALVIGAGLLNRTSAFFSIYLLPTHLLLFTKKQWYKASIVRWIGLTIVVIALSFLYYSVLNLSPEFKIIDEKNRVFIYTFEEMMRPEIMKTLPQRILTLSGWFVDYMSWPIVAAIGFVFFVKSNLIKEQLLLLVWFVAPLAALMLVGKSVFPRYIFFMTMPLYPLLGIALSKIGEMLKARKLSPLLAGILLVPLTYNSFTTVRNLPTANIPEKDRFQLANGWPAGGGTKELVEFVINQSAGEKIVVVTEGEFGSLPTTVLNIFFKNDENVARIPVSSFKVPPPDFITRETKYFKTFVVMNIGPQPPGWPLEEVAKYPKGIGTDSLRIYKWKGSPTEQL